jgi:hypothetical protein
MGSYLHLRRTWTLTPPGPFEEAAAALGAEDSCCWVAWAALLLLLPPLP